MNLQCVNDRKRVDYANELRRPFMEAAGKLSKEGQES